jgi:hypothetical protein
MLRSLSALASGACVFGTAWVTQRLIAPYAGLSLTLFVGVLAATLAGFAIGCALGAAPREPARAAWLVVRGLLLAAAATLIVARFSRPLLVALWGADLRVTVAVAAALFAGLPSLGLGFAFAVGQGSGSAADALRRGAWLFVGAALAAPLVGWVLAPRLGLGVTLALLAAVEAVIAAFSGARRAPALTAAAVLATLAASGLIAARPAAASRIGPRMLELRRGTELEYRVFDRDGARYLLADGTIHAVMDTLSGDCVQRGPSALGLLRLVRPGRDSMLVIGLRGGTLPLAFARAGWHVRVVEPDSDAVSASRRVSYRPGEMRLEGSDPRRFLRRDRDRYGAVVVDAFADSYMPYPLATREFVAQVADHVVPGGVAVVIVETQGWNDPLVPALAATLRTRFAQVLALPTSEPPNAIGTLLLLASREPLQFTDDDLPNPTTFFQNPEALWVVQQQTHAWLNRFEPGPRGARVLTDDKSAIEAWSDRLNRAGRAELHRFFGPDGGSW